MSVKDMIEECPDNGIMIDIGANIGSYTHHMAKKSKTVYAFEPEPRNIEKLKEAMKDKTNVNICEMALSNFTGTTRLMLHPGNPGGHSIHTPLAGKQWKHTLENSIVVKVMTLDDWCEKHDISGIVGIKIDVEAHEKEVLEGALETLKRNRPLIALDTHRSVDLEAVRNILQGYNYEVPELVADKYYTIRPK